MLMKFSSSLDHKIRTILFISFCKRWNKTIFIIITDDTHEDWGSTCPRSKIFHHSSYLEHYPPSKVLLTINLFLILLKILYIVKLKQWELLVYFTLMLLIGSNTFSKYRIKKPEDSYFCTKCEKDVPLLSLIKINENTKARSINLNKKFEMKMK